MANPLDGLNKEIKALKSMGDSLHSVQRTLRGIGEKKEAPPRINDYVVGIKELWVRYVKVRAVNEDEARGMALIKREDGKDDGELKFSHMFVCETWDVDKLNDAEG